MTLIERFIPHEADRAAYLEAERAVAELRLRHFTPRWWLLFVLRQFLPDRD